MSIKWFLSLKRGSMTVSLVVFLVKVGQKWLCLCITSDFYLDTLCNRSSYLLSQPLCLVIQAAHFAWLGFLPVRRHRPTMPWYRYDFPGSLRWRPRLFPGKIEHCGPCCAIKENESQFQNNRTRLRNYPQANPRLRATLWQASIRVYTREEFPFF